MILSGIPHGLDFETGLFDEPASLGLIKTDSKGWTERRVLFLPVQINQFPGRFKHLQRIRQYLAGVLEIMQDDSQEYNIYAATAENGLFGFSYLER
jgi:hypothetical protein